MSMGCAVSSREQAVDARMKPTQISRSAPEKRFARQRLDGRVFRRDRYCMVLEGLFVVRRNRAIEYAVLHGLSTGARGPLDLENT
jgi:hypothetical protein